MVLVVLHYLLLACLHLPVQYVVVRRIHLTQLRLERILVLLLKEKTLQLRAEALLLLHRLHRARSQL